MFPFLLLIFLFFSVNNCFSQTISTSIIFTSPSTISTDSPFPANLVTASPYCHFLNAAATTDLQHFYDEKMGSDLETASIVRLGTAGKFHYEVIADRENFPICYGNHFTSINYHKLSSTAYKENDDPYLRSNRTNIAIDITSPLIVTLAITPTRSVPSHEWSKFDYLSIISFAAVGMVYGPFCKAIPSDENNNVLERDGSIPDERIKGSSLDRRRAIIPPQEKKCACCEKCDAPVPLRESIDTKNLRQDDQDESAWRKKFKNLASYFADRATALHALFSLNETRLLLEERPPNYGTVSECYKAP